MARLVLRLLVVVLLAITTSSLARADSRLQFLSDQLRYPPASGQPDDFRVRTNAALALGATNDDGAVAPLCGGLDDPSAVVRQAVAVGLKKLARPSSKDCIQRHLASESNDGVKAQLQKALDALGGGGGGGGGSPAVVAGAKYYVSISPISNNTTRSGADVERIVHAAIAGKLGQLGEYQLAPAGESSSDAKAAIAKRSLKGFFLSVSVDKFDYSDGNLRVKVKIAVFSYPGKDLRGEVPAGASSQGTRPGDTSTEDQLMTLVSARAAELFAQNFK
ncbi:MAG: HEAT repeat domain-containing protein [Polyangiaceae bacterium]